MVMMLVIVGGMLLTGAFALYIARNVEHGEARFGPDGQLPPFEPPAEEQDDMRVTITQSEKTDD